MKGEQMGWHSPPKAEATGSNPVGCTKQFQTLSGVSEARIFGGSCTIVQFPPNPGLFRTLGGLNRPLGTLGLTKENPGHAKGATGVQGLSFGQMTPAEYGLSPTRASAKVAFRGRAAA